MRRKILTLFIFLAVLCLPSAAPLVSACAENLSLAGINSAGTYRLSLPDGYEMYVDKSNLNLKVERGGKVWYSGKRADSDGLESESWINRVLDGVTIGYISNKNKNETVRSISSLKPNISFEERQNGFSAKIKLETISVSFRLEVSFDSGRLTAKVPYDSIEEYGSAYSLSYMILFPFFNASARQTEGSIFVPDGSGATIDLSEATFAKKPYSARVYGGDAGISATTVNSTSPYTAQMPVFALSYPQSSSMSVILSGDDYCQLNAYTSGIDTVYNYAYAKFIYREQYVKFYSASAGSGKNTVEFQPQKNVFDIEQRFYLLEDGSLEALADTYRSCLKERKLLKDNDIAAKMRLQFLMSENKDSLFGKEVLKMTSTGFLSDLLNTLPSQTELSLLGYSKGGLSGSYPDVLPLEKKTGSKKDYIKLLEKAKAKNIKLGFAVDFTKTSAKVSSRDKAMMLSGQYAMAGDINASARDEDLKQNLLTASKTAELLTKYEKEFQKLGQCSLDVYSTGRYLFSSYKNDPSSRTEYRQKIINALSQGSLAYAIDSPNQYLFAYAESYLSAPLSNSGFIIESDSVPFLQMVLSGSVAMYSSAMNLNYMGEDDALKLIEYNVYPSFLLTQEDAIDLYGTQSGYIFTSSYAVWESKINEIRQRVCGVLSEVQNETFISHNQIESGVFECRYSSGKTIIVNYNQNPFAYNGVTIGGKSAEVLK